MGRKRRTTATLWAQDGRIRIRSDYDPDFVSALKNLIPAQHRSWMPKPDKLWTCEPAYLEDVHALCGKFFDDVSVLEGDDGEAPAGSNGSDGNAYEQFLRAAPDKLLKKFYRELVRELHPDRGGDPALTAQVNDAWKIIRQERGM